MMFITLLNNIQFSTQQGLLLPTIQWYNGHDSRFSKNIAMKDKWKALKISEVNSKEESQIVFLIMIFQMHIYSVNQ
jgi:hypothetical protein